jgi:hypothetical protein
VSGFVGDAAAPGQRVAELRDALAPGSYLVLAHDTNESRQAVTEATGQVYRRGAASAGRPVRAAPARETRP